MNAWPERRLRTALLVSLVVIAFLSGALLMSLFRGSEAAVSARTRPIASGYAQLSEAERQGFRRAMNDAAPTLEPLLTEARAARQEARRLLQEKDFDRATVAAAFERTRIAESALKVEVDRVTLQYAATLPPDRRLVVADIFRPGRRVFDAAASGKGNGSR